MIDDDLLIDCNSLENLECNINHCVQSNNCIHKCYFMKLSVSFAVFPVKQSTTMEEEMFAQISPKNLIYSGQKSVLSLVV